MLFLSSSQDIAKFGHCSVFFIFFFANLLFTSSFMLLCVCLPLAGFEPRTSVARGDHCAAVSLDIFCLEMIRIWDTPNLSHFKPLIK